MTIIKLIKQEPYFLILALLAATIPVSTFGMSVSQFFLLFYFLGSGKWNEKWNRLRNNKALPFMLLVYAVHLVGLLYTTYPEGFFGNYYTALDDLRIKLPLLILPVLIAAFPPLTFHQIKWIIYAFSLSLLISSFISTAVYLGLTPIQIDETRDISLFVSHIRVSLFVDIAFFLGLYLVLIKRNYLSKTEKWLIPVILAWFLFFLILLKAFTGIFVFAVIAGLGILLWSLRASSLRRRLLAISLLILLIFSSFGWFAHYVTQYRDFDGYQPEKLDPFTANGRPYSHDFSNLQVENQHWVGLYHNEEELRNEWNRRSKLPYDGPDLRGNNLRQTLQRYLTGLNLRKDSLGVVQLSEDDISMIEQGYANPIYKKRFSLLPRIYEIVWEVDLYLRGANPNGHSVAQRMEYGRLGWLILRENFWFGVGTGDVYLAYRALYDQNESPLRGSNQRRAHNQYLSFLIAFGLVGFSFISIGVLVPIFMFYKHINFMFYIPFAIALLSMINEDTLETQAGVTFVAFFYSLFVFGCKQKSV